MNSTMQNPNHLLDLDKLTGIAARRARPPRQPIPHALADILPSRHFLEQLRRERLRADRCRTPLSVVLFCFDPESGDEATEGRIQQFSARLRAGIRETDILGHAGAGRIGLLLTDTGREGRETCLGKLADEQGKFPVRTVAGTYPDRIFDDLLAEHRDRPQPDPFFLDADHLGRVGYASKRLVDILGAGVGILLFSPLMLLTAIAVKTTSPGPVIFRQLRLGKNGVPFAFYKFRSMAWQADDRLHREYVAGLIAGNVQAINQGEPEAPMYKIQSDPRVTPLGRILRKASIDELPQLFNVLKGDMSLVGPRPPLPYEAENYQSWHLRRIFGIKPGITGLWQVEGRSRTTFDDMVRLDLEYIRNCSLRLDLKILLRTVKAVLQGAGAA